MGRRNRGKGNNSLDDFNDFNDFDDFPVQGKQRRPKPKKPKGKRNKGKKMGQEHSSYVDEDTRALTLSERSLDAVADFIKSGKASRIVVMTGAGISTAAGIPDFRSPETGLYANLAALDLPEPEAVFDLTFFKQNPKPFYALAKELYPGARYRPTISHCFIALLARKGLLHMLFTQNIDCLERAAGIPPDRIVEAHGSFATQRCIECKVAFDDAKMRAAVARADVPTCEQECADGKRCGGLVKPDIVFFGEALPSAFFGLSDKVKEADLILVLGTSLQVHPFAGLPNMADEDVPRVLFNLERVGSFGTQADDVMVLADCDAGVTRLADLLGWKDELEKAWRELVGDEEADRQLQGPTKRAAALHDEVAKLAEEVEEVLHIDDKESGKDGESKHTDQNKESPAAPPGEAPGEVEVAGKRETPEPAVESRPPQVNPDLSGAEGQAPAKQGEKVDGVGGIADKRVDL